jgi:tetrahydromethanopterin S-methyltransferase subunit G
MTATEAEASMAEFNRIASQRFDEVAEKMQTPLIEWVNAELAKRGLNDRP